MKVTYHEAKKHLGQITSFLQSKYPESNFLVSGDFLRKKELISEIIIISNLESYPDLSDFNPIKIQKDDFVDFNGVSTTVFFDIEMGNFKRDFYWSQVGGRWYHFSQPRGLEVNDSRDSLKWVRAVKSIALPEEEAEIKTKINALIWP